MSRKREQAKGRRESGSFVALPHAVIGGAEWARLSPAGVKLLLDLYGQYRGQNNGDLTLAWSIMKPRGWKSKQTLHRAKDELLAAGWIICTRQGGRHTAGLYAVTWQAIDGCGGKLDIGETRTAPGTWKNIHAGTVLARC